MLWDSIVVAPLSAPSSQHGASICRFVLNCPDTTAEQKSEAKEFLLAGVKETGAFRLSHSPRWLEFFCLPCTSLMYFPCVIAAMAPYYKFLCEEQKWDMDSVRTLLAPTSCHV